ncbi:MAG: hypothetical protein Tsb0017_09960 [Geothermobacteraceae bacterium]
MKRILCLLIALPFILAPALAMASDHEDHKKDEGKVKLEMELKKKVDVDLKIKGDLTPFGSATAVIDNQQKIEDNCVLNQELVNDADIGGNALQGAEGNLGANVSAGTNNLQDNLTTISFTEAFGSLIDAELHKLQASQENGTFNIGTTNDAALGDNALQGASGNLGVNLAAGTGNAQSNMTAISVGPSNSGIAAAGVSQCAKNNMTDNSPASYQVVDFYDVDLDLTAGGVYGGMTHMSGSYQGTTSGQGSYSGSFSGEGGYAGVSDQIGDVYPDVWLFNDDFSAQNQHPNSEQQIAHFDLDTQTQGGSDLNGDGGALAFSEDGELGVSGSESGGLGFNGSENGTIDLDGCEVGVQFLAGTVSGVIPVVRTVSQLTTNTASLSGNALQGASGNIGVNITAGTGNLQANGLAVSALLNGNTPPIGGGTEF